MRFILSLIFLTSVAAHATAPNYSANPSLAIGHYSATTQLNCRDGISECEASEVFMKGGKPYIRMGEFFEFGNDDRVIPLQKTASGALVFSATYNDDCDSNGCANIDSIKGVVYPKAEGSKFVPQVKATIEITCGWGDDEACPYNSSETYVVRMRR